MSALPSGQAVKVASLGFFAVPKLLRSAKGVKGAFSKKGFSYRIDTNATGLAPDEKFHVHVFRDGSEVAKITHTGKWEVAHRGRTLLKPSEIDKQVRREVNQLVRAAQKQIQ